jgi:hypothetical protein
VNNILAQSYTTRVRAYRLAELGGHQEHSEYLADTGKTTRINLNYIDCVRLEELLEHHAIMCVFASGNADAVGFEFAPDAGMTEDAIDTVSCAWLCDTGVGKQK